MKYTELDKAIMIGLALGNGYINSNGRLEITHCEKQKEYCVYKAKLLHSVCGGRDIKVCKIQNEYTQRKDGKLIEHAINTKYRFRKQCKHFKYFRDLLYKNGKKTITREILDMMTPLSIALWFLDNGSLVRKKQGNESPGPYTTTIYTYATKKENEIIRDYFLEKYNVKWNVVPANIHKEDQYMIRCGQTESRKFLAIIRDIVRNNIPSMSYKVLDI